MEVIRVDAHGEWCAVPGIDNLRVSSNGMVQRFFHGRWREPFLPEQRETGYRNVQANKKIYGVHRLVCSAFHGPCPGGYSCDHIAKYNGDFMRERSDNRKDNLRWASRAEQRRNQNVRKKQRNGYPVLVRRCSWPTCTPSRWFSSAYAADDALGIRHLADVANPMTNSISAYGWTAEWASPNEEQMDLPEEGSRPAELWVQVNDTMRVSNRGRAQLRHTQYNHWHHKVTPRPRAGEMYATFGSNTLFHRVVFSAFGGTLEDGQTVDHINRDRSDNNLSNLRAATKSQQQFNTCLKRPREDNKKSLKDPVLGKPLTGDDTWERFESINMAADVLSRRFSKSIQGGNISKVVRGVRSHTCGWVFKHA